MSDISVQQLLMPDFKNSRDLILDVSESKKDFEELRQKISTHIKPEQWNDIPDKLFTHLEDLLNTPLAPVLTTSWNKFKEVYQAIEEQKKSGDNKPKVISLLSHKITSKHKPKLQVYLNDAIIHSIPLTVTLKLDLKGIKLLIADGKISEIQSGTCEGKGDVKYFKAALLPEKEIFKFALPGKVTLNQERAQGMRQIDLVEQIGTIEKGKDDKKKRSTGIGFYLLGIMLTIVVFFLWLAL